MALLEHLLLHSFGLSGFRPFQREVIECVLSGNSALAVLPTGGGKSLCYQLPALMLPGITLVVSPLISLMKDQVDSLVERGVAAIAVNSHDTLSEMRRKLADIKSGQVKIVYVAPERLRNAGFLEVCRHCQISLIAVDEAHCVSQWGHDFRPDYRFIKDFRCSVGNPPLLALTATATRRVQKDVLLHLGISGAQSFLADTDRPNLWLGIEHCATMVEKQSKVLALASRVAGSVIVYVSSRKDAEAYATLLENALGEPVAAYHAGLTPDARTATQNRFMAGLTRVVTATNAFGMGIDKADIRAVIHAGVPESMEAYFQEIGRAGRDGEPAECTLVVVPGRDIKMRQYLMEKDAPTQAQIQALLQKVTRLSDRGEGLIPLSEGTETVDTLALSYLQAAGKLELGHRTPQGIMVTSTGAIDDAVEETIWSEIQSHMQVKREQFRRVRNFIYLETCRRRYLMDYFGEQSIKHDTDCCSACHPRPVVAMTVPKLTLPKTAKPKFAPPVTINPTLLDRLKAWRRTQAEARQVPAYVVFGDNDLSGIAAAAPCSLDELAACRGVGPAKLQLYGEEIISIVASTVAEQQVIAKDASRLFSTGKTLAEVVQLLACDEGAAWSFFLTWVASTSDDIWKQQVRRVISPETYVAIRAELRKRPSDRSINVDKDLFERFGYRQVTLTRTIMDRVGEK